MSQDIGPGVRAEVLRWASVLAPEPADHGTVLLTANPLVTWLEAAPDSDDLTTRITAMRQQFHNLPFCQGDPCPGPASVDGFMESVAAYHRFLNAGEGAAR